MAEDAPYDFYAEKCTVTVDTEHLGVNGLSRNAYTAFRDINVGESGTTVSVTLSSPFARLNIGTNDLRTVTSGLIDLRDVTVKVPVYTTYDLAGGTVKNREDVIFQPAAVPDSKTSPFPVNGYDYLVTAFALAPSAQETCEIELFLNPTGTSPTPLSTFRKVPLQRHYLTNLFGSLLLEPNQFNIIVSSNFDSSVSTWDGNDEIHLNEDEVLLMSRTINQGLKVSGRGVLTIENCTIDGSGTTQPALTIAADADVRLNIVGNVRLTGGRNCDGIRVEDGAKVEIVGEMLTATGNNGNNDTRTGGSGIGNAGGNSGDITIHNLTNLTVSGGGVGGYGVGGKNATVNISSTTIESATGGLADFDETDIDHPTIGGAAIGSSGGRVVMTDCIVKKAVGGNGCSAIGGDNGSIDVTINGGSYVCRGGAFAAGIGSGFRGVALSGSVNADVSNVVAGSTPAGSYSTPQAIGYGALSSDETESLDVTFTVNGHKIEKP